ncbi:hypothetical protein PMAYCL1PPCAC_08320, partial [Pristionchus mayeri]
SQIYCIVCGTWLCSVRDIKHLMNSDHFEKMKKRKMMFPLEPLAFWMHALRLAQSEEKSVPVHLPTVARVKPEIYPTNESRSPLAVLFLHTEVPNPCK